MWGLPLDMLLMSGLYLGTALSAGDMACGEDILNPTPSLLSLTAALTADPSVLGIYRAGTNAGRSHLIPLYLREHRSEGQASRQLTVTDRSLELPANPLQPATAAEKCIGHHINISASSCAPFQQTCPRAHALQSELDEGRRLLWRSLRFSTCATS
ncbi:hypothetical protein XELAEV_18043973mg [Xenopus laevis]|uniref:Uncharacterized protein n=1 Tax=Xenopus laevis TaxID=8355 RepID=A0A974H2V5_XENLA|nr:hypothetical protein XELAEV_18043973mg [Xenopus laevis]